MSLVSFGEILLEPIRNGLTKPKAVRGNGVKMIAMGEIFACSRIGNIKMDRVPVTEKEKNNCAIKEGDLLFARQSLVLEGAGKCSIVTSVTEDTVFESHLIRARIDPQKANPYFLYYFFNSYMGTCELKVCSTMKPDNPTVLLVLPAVPELSALCIIRAFGLKGGKNVSGNNA